MKKYQEQEDLKKATAEQTANDELSLDDESASVNSEDENINFAIGGQNDGSNLTLE